MFDTWRNAFWYMVRCAIGRCIWLRRFTEVAYRVGFNNLSNFDRRFRRIVGMAPRQYRAAHRPLA